MAVSSAQKELDKLGAQLAELFPNASRISVFSRPLNTAPLKEVWCSGSSGQILGMDGERVLGTVEKWKRTVLIEDARTNQLVRGVTSRRFDSCLAVPILDDTRHVKGLIYLTASNAGAFNSHGRFACENLAKGTRETLERLGQPDESTSEIVAPGVEGFAYLPQLLLAGCAIAVLSAVTYFIAPTEVADPTVRVGSVRLGPRDVARGFLQHLRVGEFGSAWEDFEPSLQSRWSRENFVTACQVWSSEEAHQFLLLNRDVGLITTESGRTQVSLPATSLKEDDGTHWTWVLVEGSSGWKIVDIEGGPVTL